MALTATASAGGVVVAGTALRQRLRRNGGWPPAALRGTSGVAVTELTPVGVVRVGGENWSAESVSGPLPAGAPVHVLGARGVRLEVWSEVGTVPDATVLDTRGGSAVIAVIVAIAVIIVVALLAGAAAAIRIVREYQRVVVFRLGRSSGARGPGLVVINPITDRVTLVDLREQFLEVPHQVAITKDNASIAIDFIIFTKVFDPVMSVLAVKDFRGAALNVAATTLRAVVGDMSLDEVLSKREDMNNTLRFKLDDVTERWGVKVTNVEVREINPPPGVLDAMTRQMSAERTRRAVVTEAEGTKQAAITVAEGQKQSAILAAEGDRQAAIVQAEGFALALQQIYQSAKGLDRQHHDPPVLRGPQEAGRLARHQVRGAHGAVRDCWPAWPARWASRSPTATPQPTPRPSTPTVPRRAEGPRAARRHSPIMPRSLPWVARAGPRRSAGTQPILPLWPGVRRRHIPMSRTGLYPSAG